MRPHHLPQRPFVLATLAAACVLLVQPAAAQSAEAARQAVRKALQSNPEVQSRLNAFLAKTDGVDIARAGFLPRVDLSADAGTERSRDKGVVNQSSVNRAGVSLAVTQTLWDGFSTQRDVSRAQHERMARWFEFVDASEQLSLDAARAVYDVQRQRKLVALAEDNLAQHRAAATKIESRVGAGVGRGVDLDQARARVALAESNLETELANLHDVAARYQRIVGETPPPEMGALEVLRAGMPRSAEEAMGTALSKSPVIAAGIENLRAARAVESQRKSAFQPKVEARARVGGGKNYSGVVDRQGDAAVELVMNWNLFAGGADQARVREQANLVGQALDLRDKACRDVRQNVAVAYNDAIKLNNQLSVLARNSAAIERAREAYRQQFDIGQRSLLDLLNAENEGYTARRALTNAVYDRAVAHARTLAAMSQLNVHLEIARDLLPKGMEGWSAGDDGAGRCPPQTVDMGALRAGLDPVAAAASVLAAATPGAAPGGQPAGGALQPMAAVASPVAMAGVAGAVSAAGSAHAHTAGSPGAGAAGATLGVAPRIARPASTADSVARVTPLVNAWAAAQRSRDLSSLAALYAPGFSGDEPSARHWMAKQQAALGRGKAPVKLELDGLVAEPIGDGVVETRFRQVQTAGTGTTVQEKVLLWKQMGNGQWRIAREETI